MRAGRAWFAVLAFCATAFAADDAVLIRNADVYPVTGAVMKGVSLLIQDGKIAEIGAKITAPKAAKIVEAKGMRIYPGMIDSGSTLGLSEIGAERVTVDTNELGEFIDVLFEERFEFEKVLHAIGGAVVPDLDQLIDDASGLRLNRS